MPLEVACFTPGSAILAARAGAERIELCSQRSTGGLTPTLSDVSQINEVLGKDRPALHVMIRVNDSMDFMATEEEVDAMCRQIVDFKPFIRGFVLGLLSSNGAVDKESNSRLLGLAHPLPCTFHRAIDRTPSPTDALETIISLGFAAILTSGGAETARAGSHAISRLVTQARGRIDIIAGGGVRAGVVDNIVRETGVKWVHSSGITSDGGDEVDPAEVKRLLDALRK